jgi:hypothetical protein
MIAVPVGIMRGVIVRVAVGKTIVFLIVVRRQIV